MGLFVSLHALDINNLINAHKKALNTFQKKEGDFYKSIKLLRDAHIQEILQQKPEELSESQYINILNDYGFFLSLTVRGNIYIAPNYCEAQQVLDRVKTLDPQRIAVYLNLGDLYWKMFLAESYIGGLNAGAARSFQDAKCFFQENEKRPYMAKLMYQIYAQKMRAIGKENKIPKRLDFILNNNTMFVLVEDYWKYSKQDRNATFQPCQDYIAALNSLPDEERTYCNRDISKVNTEFKIIGWDDVNNELREKWFDVRWDKSYEKNNVAFDYKNRLFINTFSDLWQQSLYGDYMVKG